MLAARIPSFPWVNTSLKGLFDLREQLYACSHQLQFSSKWRTGYVEFMFFWFFVFHVSGVKAQCTVSLVVCCWSCRGIHNKTHNKKGNCLHILYILWKYLEYSYIQENCLHILVDIKKLRSLKYHFEKGLTLAIQDGLSQQQFSGCSWHTSNAFQYIPMHSQCVIICLMTKTSVFTNFYSNLLDLLLPGFVWKTNYRVSNSRH